LYKHKDKPYHLDYCFASTDMTDNIQSVEIGDHDLWKPYSDHVPVMITFNSGYQQKGSNPAAEKDQYKKFTR
jgi:hypothetical protein